MTFLAETPPVCPVCSDNDPFCSAGCTPAPEPLEQPHMHVPEEGDKIEVKVGALWLPATVVRAAYHGPMAVEWWDGGVGGGVTGSFNFRLDGSALYISSAAWVVGDEGKWRWPEGRP